MLPITGQVANEDIQCKVRGFDPMNETNGGPAMMSTKETMTRGGIESWGLQQL